MGLRSVVAALCCVLVWSLACGGGGGGGEQQAPANENKEAKGEGRVVVLVFDGIDPDYVDQWRSTTLGAMESLVGSSARVRRLSTTTPPADPVFWATLANGVGPDTHGVFGHVVRDPETYLPRPGGQRITPPIWGGDGSLQQALDIDDLAEGEPFWEVAARDGIPTKVLFAPYAQPLAEIEGLELVAGQGTPDLAGTPGTYTIWETTTDKQKDAPRGGRRVPLTGKGPHQSTLLGPVGPDGEPLALPVTFERAGSGSVKIRFAGADAEVELDARAGEFTAWTPVAFSTGSGNSVRGLVRFFVVDAVERLQIYASPVIVDPNAPAFPVSSPNDYAAELHEAYGDLKHLGWEHETMAVSEGVVPTNVFARDRSSLSRVRTKAILGELDAETKLFVAFLHDPDRVWHLLSSQLDRGSPAYDADVAALYGGMLKESYSDMDRFVAQVQEKLGASDTLIILSPHGFHPWHWSVNLNRWLLDEGYLVLKEDADKSPRVGGHRTPDGWQWDVDWEASRAYAMGHGAIYLNLAGREAQGSLESEEAQALAKELEKKLEEWKHEQERVVGSVHVAVDRGGLAPDLQVGFAPGFAASRATVVGEIPTKVIERNERLWAGDHSSNAAEQTQGFVIATFAAIPLEPKLVDVAPTVLSLLGVEAPDSYEGKAWK